MMSAPRQWFRCAAVTIVVIATSVGSANAQPRGDDVAALERQVRELHRQRKNAEALPIAERYLALAREQHGDEHLTYATALAWAGHIYRALGRVANAEEAYKRSLAIREKAGGTAQTALASAISNLAGLYGEHGRTSEADVLLVRALAIREKALGPNHVEVGNTLAQLARVRRDQRRFAEAETLHKRALANHEGALGGNHATVALDLIYLGDLYRDIGRVIEAEPLYKRAIAIYEKAHGPDDGNVGTGLGNLAEVYRTQRRYAEAEPLYKRSLAIHEKASGSDHSSVATTLSNLALLYRDQNRFSSAQPLQERVIAIYEKARGPEHPTVGIALGLLADTYRSQGRPADAEPLIKRALAIHEKSLGADHPHVSTSLALLSRLYRDLRRLDEAEPLLLRAASIQEQAFGEDAPNLSRTLAGLASIALARRDWQRATDFYRRSTSLMAKRAGRDAQDAHQNLAGKGTSEAEALSWQFGALVKVMYQLARERSEASVALRSEMFQTAQWALASDAAQSLAQMAARSTKGDPALASLVRERQDLVGEWQRLDIARNAALALSPNQRDGAAVAANASRLMAIDARIAEIDASMKTQFPDYAALAKSETLSVEQVQKDLHYDEALLLFLDTPATGPLPEETFIWVITKSGVRSTRSPLGTSGLKREVAALRCGLDRSAWDGDDGRICAGLLDIVLENRPQGADPLPFDPARAHKLYQNLLGPVADLVQGKHLLIVPSGSLTQLPFHVLVTKPADPLKSESEAYRTAAWLTRTNAITVLPAVSSVKALRQHAKTSRAVHRLVGFGNPLLDGDPASRPWEAAWAKLARDKQVCLRAAWERQVSQLEHRRSVLRVATSGGRADLEHLKAQSPLHDTADELCAVAQDLALGPDDILLGARATEGMVKKLSGEGKLAGYRVVHFATHGTLAGEIEGTSEPGLILTPPRQQTEEDDGYLAASEVATLKLDADWVILSACNTAAGGSDKAEALSGLARAFFYAGARSLLVSHWAVDSEATVRLITHAVAATAQDSNLGRAEALRRSMLNMVDGGDAHPALWAPFVVVGEGASPK